VIISFHSCTTEVLHRRTLLKVEDALLRGSVTGFHGNTAVETCSHEDHVDGGNTFSETSCRPSATQCKVPVNVYICSY
jgi:hypothetical protein